MKRSRKILVALAAGGATLAIASAAFAYFTTTGSGTGTGTTGTSAAVTIHGTVSSLLYPGTSSPVTFTVDNPSSGHQYVNTIQLTGVATDGAHSTCNLADYTMANVSAATDVPSGNGNAITATGTLVMANTSVSQDACKNAPLTLTFTSN
jgi:hypothetical protein